MKKQKGIAVITVLMILVIISIMGMAFLETGGADYIFAVKHKNDTRAYFLAWAGVEYACAVSEEGNSADNIISNMKDIKLLTGACSIEAKKIDVKKIEVACTGKPLNSNRTKTITAVIQDGVVLDWRQR
ncbi:MAG: hypothetical protein ABIH00_02220 [Armatimonadota bacterium]